MNDNNKSMAKVIIGGFAAACTVVGGVAFATYQVAKKMILNSYISDDEATKTAGTIDGTFEETTEENSEEVNTTDEPTEFGE